MWVIDVREQFFSFFFFFIILAQVGGNRYSTIDNFFIVARRQFSVALMELASTGIYDVTGWSIVLMDRMRMQDCVVEADGRRRYRR